MRHLRSVAAISCSLAVALASPVAAADKPDDAYRTGIARLNAGDATVDLVALRMRHAELFGGYDNGAADRRSAARAAVEKQDWQALLTVADAWIEEDYLSIAAHLYAERAYTGMDRKADAAREHAFVRRMIQAITQGHDGRSADQAWTVMNVDEEYVMMALLGYQPQGQALINKDGHSFDTQRVVDTRSGKSGELWFNIDSFFGKSVP